VIFRAFLSALLFLVEVNQRRAFDDQGCMYHLLVENFVSQGKARSKALVEEGVAEAASPSLPIPLAVWPFRHTRRSTVSPGFIARSGMRSIFSMRRTEISQLTLAAGMLAANLALSSMAFAQGTAPADVRVIDACLTTAEKTGGFGGACIGLVADPCIKAAAGVQDDVAKWRACAARELAIWTQKTSEALKKVDAGGFADVIKAVRDSQTTFAASRDRFCAVFDKIEPGMYRGDASYCRLRETANRALSLIKLGAAVNEH
jgi:hypothetical protein